MNKEIWAGEVGEVYSYPEGPVEVTGSAIVTDVDIENKVVSLDAEEAKKEEIKEMLTKGVGELQFKPEEEAAAKYTYLLPIARRLSTNMSAKSMARVVMALAEYPLQQTEKPRLRSKEEQQLFQVVFEINAAKGTILQYAREQAMKNQTLSDSSGQEIKEGETTDVN